MPVQIIRRITILLLAGMLALSACSDVPAGGSSAPGSTTTPAAQTAIPAETTQPVPQAAATAAATAASAANVSAPTATTGANATSTATLPAAPPKTALVPSTGDAVKVPADTVTAFPDPAGYAWAPFVSGLINPLDMAFLPDNSGRVFIVEQPGTIRVAQNGNLLPDPLLDIRDRVGSQGNEQGLLGIALHPNFSQNDFFFVNYTDSNGNTVIARFQVTKENPNRADPNSEKVLLRVDQPFPNHNGGSMVFGPDGYLYMGLGDGGSAGDPHGNGQSVNTFLGKILRVDVNHGDPYTIPADNPFAKGNGKAEIWAYGLRNPWRFSFDRLTGDLFIADVGQDLWEEIDFLPAGSPGGTDFGWNYREGKHEFHGIPPANLKLIGPVAEYGHGEGCSVTGGFVYRGEALPEFRGVYFYSDYCSGKVWGLLKGANGSWQSQELFETGYNITSFGQDRQGEIYIIDQGSGSVFRLQKN